MGERDTLMRGPVHPKLGTAFSRPARPRRFRRSMLAAAAVLILLLVWFGSLYYQIVTFHGVSAQDGPFKADVGIVLGASLWNDEPSPGLRERLDHALALYRKGVFQHMIVTGGFDNKRARLSEAEGMRNYLLGHGVPVNEIWMDTKSYNTYENLRNAREIMEEHDWRNAVIVTHRYHGARAADIAGVLHYKPVLVSVTDSKVMNMAYHETREILAFTKWKLDKIRLSLYD